MDNQQQQQQNQGEEKQKNQKRKTVEDFILEEEAEDVFNHPSVKKLKNEENEVFFKECQNGTIHLQNPQLIFTRSDRVYWCGMKYACQRNDSLSLFPLSKDPRFDATRAFVIACRDGTIDAVRYLLKMSRIKISFSSQNVYDICSRTDEELLTFLLSDSRCFQELLDNELIKFAVLFDRPLLLPLSKLTLKQINQIFTKSCSEDKLQVVKHVFDSVVSILAPFELQFIFHSACWKNCSSVCEFLLEKIPFLNVQEGILSVSKNKSDSLLKFLCRHNSFEPRFDVVKHITEIGVSSVLDEVLRHPKCDVGLIESLLNEMSPSARCRVVLLQDSRLQPKESDLLFWSKNFVEA
jgi:hypothetical protein